MAAYASPQASPYRGRLLRCIVLMLDDTEQMFQIPVCGYDAKRTRLYCRLFISYGFYSIYV